MKRSIDHRMLTPAEKNILMNVTKTSPHLGFVSERAWGKFGKIFVLSESGNLLGVCVTVPLDGWIKIGPLLVLPHMQGKGLGMALVTHVVKNFSGHNLYVGTGNPKVVHIAHSLGFRRVNFWQLAWTVKKYLLLYPLRRANAEYVRSSLRKRLTSKKWSYAYFVKPAGE